jgi:hypothetical protein
MLPSLDRNRAFGEIHGENEFGARFEQDTFLFDATGALIEDAMGDSQRAKLKQLQDQDEAMERAREAFRSVMPDASKEMIDKIINTEGLNAPVIEEAIDLAAWASGQKQYLYSKVAAEIRRQFDQSPVNKKQALEILAEHGVITAAPGAATIPSMT